MKHTFIIYIIIFSVFNSLQAQNTEQSSDPHEIVENVVQHFYKIKNNFSTEKSVWSNYTLDLTLESMLFYDIYTNSSTYTRKVEEILELRKLKSNDTIRYEGQPFCSLNFALLEATKDSAYIAPYLYETERKLKDAEYSKEGAILAIHGKTRHVLIDYMQEFTSRLARAGQLSGDTSYFVNSVKHYSYYSNILRNPENGLYSLGRGWMENPSELSPGYWSRGHGWLIRGMVSTLQALPRESPEYFILQKHLIELADALLLVQNKSGMWHVLLTSPNNSYEETSGTGMIAYYLAIAYKNGFINSEKYKTAILKSTNALKKRVSTNGTIIGTSPGPGPLRNLDKYYNKKQGNIDDGHAVQAIIYGMIAEILLKS